jgi:hypothetical protein
MGSNHITLGSEVFFMETGIRGNLFSVAMVLAVCGAVALIASTTVAAKAYQARNELTQRNEQTLQVTGSARKRIRSDLAIWTVRVSAAGRDLKSAYATLKTGVDKVTEFLKARKFEASEIAPGAIGTTVHHARDWRGQETSEISGYALSRGITITTARVDAIASPAADVTELIQDGLDVVSETPEFIYTKLGDLKIEMLGEASKDARARGDQIVINAGSEITDIRSARMGVLQITRPNSTEVSSSGVNDTSSIEKDVTAVVSLTLGLKGH